MAISLSCPSCNTRFTLPELPADQRASCPRCGDLFPGRHFTQVADSTPAAQQPSPVRQPIHGRVAAARWSVQRTVLVALAMGLVGLAAGVGVYSLRSGDRSKTPAPTTSHGGSAIPPSQLVGIGYLPSETSIAFAIQPGPLLAYAERTKQEPRELLIRAGLPRQALDAIAGLGLTLEQIDHLAGGVNVAEAGLTLVLVLRRPLDDEDAFLKHLKAKPSNGTKGRYRVDVPGLPLELALARVTPTTWVFGLDEKRDLAAAGRGGYGPGGTQFTPGLTEMLARVPPDAAAWLATTDDRWDDKPLVKLALAEGLKQKDWRTALSKGRSLTAAISLDNPPRLRLFVKTADAGTGEQVRAYFARRAAADDAARHGGAGELAFFDAPIEPANVFATLRQMLNDAVKP